MKLSEISIDVLRDEDIDTIVYEGVEDTKENAYYGLVFGNSMLIKERVNTAVEVYKRKRVQKLIFTGGIGGVSNQNNDLVSEARKMEKLALELGVKKEDIIIEEKSNNTFENIDNALSLLNPNFLDRIILITSEFHLKRCQAIFLNKYPSIKTILVPSKDGFSDRENWFLSDNSYNSGRSLATYEANLLIRYAKERKIADLEVLERNSLKKENKK